MEPFRVASTASDSEQPASTAPSPTPTVAEKGAEPGLFSYLELKGIPLTAKHFDLELFYKDKHYESMAKDIDALDEWVRNKATERGLKDSLDSYEEIINEIFKQIGQSDNERPLNKFERLNKAVKALNRLDEAKLPPVLDAHSLTAQEFKETRGNEPV